jgi:lysophospholipase L1-like esterase
MMSRVRASVRHVHVCAVLFAAGCHGHAPAPVGHAESSSNGSRWDWIGIVGTGQSLSVGAEGKLSPSTAPPSHNLKLSLGPSTVPPFDPASPSLSLIPLAEPIRSPAHIYPSAYPANIYGETPHTAMGEEITALGAIDGGPDTVTVHTVVGESGQDMATIDKSAHDVTSGATSRGRAYAATLFETAAIARLARQAGKTYGVAAVVVTHGESDAGNARYEDALLRLASDYGRDIAASTGQTAPILLIESQQESVPEGRGSTSASTLAQWRAGVDHPREIVCSGPKYALPYAPDGVHLTADGYDRLGEKYGQVFVERVVRGHDWQPLQPLAASRAGALVTVAFHVPVPPLVWDETMPPAHTEGIPEWAAGRGFEVTADGRPVAIRSVAIAGDAVQITCDVGLEGRSVRVGYAFTSDAIANPGGTRRWGSLRDSDPFVGATTRAPLPNYGVSFSMPVP